MNDEAFSNLKKAREHAGAFDSGKRRDLKVTRNEGPLRSLKPFVCEMDVSRDR
jgi:hypothetical protein